MLKNIKIAILGMGYVGLPLAIEYGKYFPTIGFDINKKKINNLKKFLDENNEVSKNEIKKSKSLLFSDDLDSIYKCNFYIICVPTPIYKNNRPNLNFLKNAAKIVSKVIKNKDFVVFESTVYPGVTENIVKDIISKKSGIKLATKEDAVDGIHFGYSPERLNPGEKNRKLFQITKVVAGSSPYATKIISAVYSKVQKNNIFVANSIKVAEAAKVIENVQRDVNIALVNEFTKIFNKSNINIFDVLKTSSTKWNFHNYYPGLVGGHCIGVDPYYLSYFSKLHKVNPLMITSGRKINDEMYKLFLNEKYENIKNKNFNLKKIKLLIMGYSFKKNCADIRNTQIEKIYNSLSKKIKSIKIFDPIINTNELPVKIKRNIIKFPKKNNYDVILIAVDHDFFFNLGKKRINSFLLSEKSLVFDFNNLFNYKEYIHF